MHLGTRCTCLLGIWVALIDAVPLSTHDGVAEKRPARHALVQFQNQAPPPVTVPAYKACQGVGTAKGSPKVGWLWSFPGSGNTVMRLLVDAASGLASGSQYNDSSLFEALPGEALDATNPRTSEHMLYVKTHGLPDGPGWLFNLSNEAFSLPSPLKWPLITRTAMVVRDPYDAILAEYARENTGSHTGEVTSIDDFPAFEEQTKVLALAYNQTIEAHLECEGGAPSRPCSATHTVKFEDILKSDGRAELLRSLVGAGGIWVDNKRLECAYRHAETYHRHSSLKAHDVFCDPAISDEFRSRLALMIEKAAIHFGYTPLSCTLSSR